MILYFYIIYINYQTSIFNNKIYFKSTKIPIRYLIYNLMRINNFKNFQVNEKVGVAEATMFYIDPIFNSAWQEFIEFYQSDEKKIDKTEEIDYKTIRPNITDKFTYAQFPIVGIELNVVFNKMTEPEFNKKYKYTVGRLKKMGKTHTHSVGGYAVNFGQRNWSGYSRLANPIKEVSDHGIVIHCGFSIDLSPSYNIVSDKKSTQDDLEEAIWHELNHLYEYYNRVLTQGGRIQTRGPSISITTADVNRWGIPKDIYDFWVYNFTFYLYASEPHELNAQVQEAAYWVGKYGFSKIEKTPAWKMANSMQKFNAEKFIEGLDNEINKYILSKDPETTALTPGGVLSRPLRERIKNMWVQQYTKSLETHSEEETIPLTAVRKMKCDEFAKYFQKRINDSGTYLKKKLSKLYILSPNEDHE